jgi:hypothetical protein
MRTLLFSMVSVALLFTASVAGASCTRGKLCDEEGNCVDVVICCDQNSCVVYYKKMQ